MKERHFRHSGLAAIVFVAAVGNGVFASEASVSAWQKEVANGSSQALVELALFYGQSEQNPDEARAFDLLFLAASRYDEPVAQVNLGVLYQFGGNGIEVSLPRAAYWYARAAESGNAAGQARLGDLYSRGFGTEVDFEKAAPLYMKSADSGYADAQLEMGYIYEMGDLGDVNYDLALSFYEKAAEQGNEIAQYNLAEMYELGKGVAINLEQARKWYGLSAEQGLQEAQDALERLQ